MSLNYQKVSCSWSHPLVNSRVILTIGKMEEICLTVDGKLSTIPANFCSVHLDDSETLGIS